jgi:carboxypeptidase Q
MHRLFATAACAAALAFGLGAGSSACAQQVDMNLMNRIADQGFNHSQVMDSAEYLADHIGGRMTNSPAMRLAEAWTQKEFTEWGLKNVHADGFDFGRGWWIETATLRMVEPRPLTLKSIPLAWTPGTEGPVTAELVLAPMTSEADFGRWKGKLAGKIVLTSAPTPPRDDLTAPFQRLTDAELTKLGEFEQPVHDSTAGPRNAARRGFQTKLDAFLKAEGAIARATMSRSEGRLVHGEGSGYKVGQTPAVPAVEIAAEDYRKLTRLMKSGPVKLEINTRVHYEDADHNAYNIIAEIPGRDPKAGYVMAGAHLDSWVAGDGASDNGAGAVVVMEAARILATLHVQPKRTIRFVLWAGEEQGLLGSYAYTEKYLAKRPLDTAKGESSMSSTNNYPIVKQPGFSQMAGYFNLDNGSGKIRGIYAEGNFAVAPIFKTWLAPFAGMGADTVVPQSTGSTDHVFLAKLGLPAFQFIQDPLDYESRVHHTDLDVYDHMRAGDLRQASVIMAAMLMDAADRDEPLPSNVLPTQPSDSDPFAEPPAPGRRAN